MDVHIGEMHTTVRAVDDRTLLSPEVMEVVVREVATRLEREQGTASRAKEEAAMWSSVRSRDFS